MQNREQSVKREDTEISVVLTPKNIPPDGYIRGQAFCCAASCLQLVKLIM